MDYSRHILALDDAELERFVLRWLQVMTTPKYFSTQRFAGPVTRVVTLSAF